MESWREELYSNELYHHGIEGQKWGVRNGPPYPLDKAQVRASSRRILDYHGRTNYDNERKYLNELSNNKIIKNSSFGKKLVDQALNDIDRIEKEANELKQENSKIFKDYSKMQSLIEGIDDKLRSSVSKIALMVEMSELDIMEYLDEQGYDYSDPDSRKSREIYMHAKTRGLENALQWLENYEEGDD